MSVKGGRKFRRPTKTWKIVERNWGENVLGMHRKLKK